MPRASPTRKGRWAGSEELGRAIHYVCHFFGSSEFVRLITSCLLSPDKIVTTFINLTFTRPRNRPSRLSSVAPTTIPLIVVSVPPSKDSTWEATTRHWRKPRNSLHCKNQETTGPAKNRIEDLKSACEITRLLPKHVSEPPRHIYNLHHSNTCLSSYITSFPQHLPFTHPNSMQQLLICTFFIGSQGIRNI